MAKLSMLLFLLWSQNCGTRKPGIENDKFRIPAFSHDGVTKDCNSCHEKDRDVAPHPQVTDCSECHAFPSFKTLTKAFTHDPTPQSCAHCHEKDRPSSAHPKTGECNGCHSFPSWKKS